MRIVHPARPFVIHPERGYLLAMNLPTDNDAVVSGGETLREARSRGGRGKRTPSLEAIAKKANLKATASSAPDREQLRNRRLAASRQWLSGNYSLKELASMHGVPFRTMQSWSKRDSWPPRPTGSLVGKMLPSLVDGSPSDTVEHMTATAEGRRPNEEQVNAERARLTANRKAGVLRRNRDVADRYHHLALKTMELLTTYAEGKMERLTVVGKDKDGFEVHTPFYLISKTHGFADGVYRVGMIAEKSIKLDRLAHGLENVDGDGNPIKLGKGGVQDPNASKRTDELERELDELMSELRSPGRLTPRPSGFVDPMVAPSPVVPTVPSALALPSPFDQSLPDPVGAAAPALPGLSAPLAAASGSGSALQADPVPQPVVFPLEPTLQDVVDDVLDEFDEGAVS